MVLLLLEKIKDLVDKLMNSFKSNHTPDNMTGALDHEVQPPSALSEGLGLLLGYHPGPGGLLVG